jgi:hypothetical protein
MATPKPSAAAIRTQFSGGCFQLRRRRSREPQWTCRKLLRIAPFDAMLSVRKCHLLFGVELCGGKRMDDALAATVQEGTMGAFLFIDLDDFNTLNDTFRS